MRRFENPQGQTNRFNNNNQSPGHSLEALRDSLKGRVDAAAHHLIDFEGVGDDQKQPVLEELATLRSLADETPVNLGQIFTRALRLNATLVPEMDEDYPRLANALRDLEIELRSWAILLMPKRGIQRPADEDEPGANRLK